MSISMQVTEHKESNPPLQHQKTFSLNKHDQTSLRRDKDKYRKKEKKKEKEKKEAKSYNGENQHKRKNEHKHVNINFHNIGNKCADNILYVTTPKNKQENFMMPEKKIIFSTSSESRKNLFLPATTAPTYLNYLKNYKENNREQFQFHSLGDTNQQKRQLIKPKPKSKSKSKSKQKKKNQLQQDIHNHFYEHLHSKYKCLYVKNLKAKCATISKTLQAQTVNSTNGNFTQLIVTPPPSLLLNTSHLNQISNRKTYSKLNRTNKLNKTLLSGVTAITSHGNINCGTNAIQCGELLTDTGIFTGPLSVGTNPLVCGSITTSGNFTCGTNSLTCGELTATNITATGITCGTDGLLCSGVISSIGLTCGINPVTCGNLNSTSITTGIINASTATLSGSLGIVGSMTCDAITSSSLNTGNILASTLTTSGSAAIIGNLFCSYIFQTVVEAELRQIVPRQTLPNNVVTALYWNSSIGTPINIPFVGSTSTNSITIAVSGWYGISAWCDTIGGINKTLTIKLDGRTVAKQAFATNQWGSSVSASGGVRCVAGNVFVVEMYQNTGAAQSVDDAGFNLKLITT